MKSPFPGMDPYLERHWRDVHQALVTYTRDSLNLQLPESLTARVEKRVSVELDSEPATEGYVTVIDQDGRVVTVIEFLSPANKRGEGLRDYLDKRATLLEGGVNLVEIDLVRQGDWRALVDRRLTAPQFQTTYRVMTRRPGDRRRIEFFPIPLQSPLPVLPVPLRASDPDAVLNLQALLEQAYRNGRYGRTDYRQPCDPPLEGEDAAWAARLLSEQGRR